MSEQNGLRKVPLGVLAMLLLVSSVVSGADPEGELSARWQGGTVLVRLPIASSCDGFFNDNDVVGSRVDSKARHRFDAGEVARVDRINVKRNRVDVQLELSEGVLEEVQDGPFTLYDAKVCKVQLKVPVPDRSDGAAVDRRLAELLERVGSVREAEASPGWNGRRRASYPPDYEETLAAHAAWKAAQVNAAVQARMDDAIEEAARVTDRVRAEPDYLDGFAAGLDKARDLYYGDCPSLLTKTFSPSSGGGGKSSDWRRGYEDGQRLGFHVELLRYLRGCFVPVPPAPEAL
ncbi:MAG TPA: hypothetical protein DD490_35200 [Acidobacteria bacterium]|nr:hypothetical protein [Acidobacteriota bacterium]